MCLKATAAAPHYSVERLFKTLATAQRPGHGGEPFELQAVAEDELPEDLVELYNE